jgi:broad specificity phosphatase PhoE
MKTSTRMVRLFLIRHGETEDNIHMRYLGIRDIPLTDNGRRQASCVADALSMLPIVSVISSPLRRAADTAAFISKSCSVRLHLDSRLMEGSFGEWEGQTRDQIISSGGKNAELLACWETDPFCAPPGGESIKSIQDRVIDLAGELIDQFPDASIALVSHVGPIKALLSAVLNIPLQATRRLFLDPATISVVEWGTHPFVRLLNSHSHLGWDNARWMFHQEQEARSKKP